MLSLFGSSQPSEAELLAVAASEAKQTTISWDEFLKRVRTSPSYKYTSTHWYKAGAALDQLPKA